jgi:RimJ/RimL family protein N-acetyltransferase
MKRNKHWKNLKEGFSVRPASMNDAESAVELFNECSMDMMGVQDFSVQEIKRDWQSPGFDLAKDARVVFGATGKLVGFVNVWSNSNLPIHSFVWGRVKPEYENLGIGTEMLKWGIDRAKDAIARVPQNARVSVNAYAVSSHTPSKQLLEDNGMKLFR